MGNVELLSLGVDYSLSHIASLSGVIHQASGEKGRLLSGKSSKHFGTSVVTKHHKVMESFIHPRDPHML